MKYYIIAGEASGDLHGSNLMKAVLKRDPEAVIRYWGGDKMQAVSGGAPVRHIRDLAFMGFVEVIRHLGTILGNIKFCKQDILSFQPDVLVLIDYPGFNMRIAKWARKESIKVAYYISPQIWAWKEKRVHELKRNVDQMLVILPFEKDFYKKHQMDVTYVGHPLLEVIEHVMKQPVVSLSQKQIIALLPGSRRQEIEVKLPIMLSVINAFPDYHFIIAQAPNLEEGFYNNLIGDKINSVSLVKDMTYQLLRQAEAALVTSGTATLEAALLKCPEIVCYKGNPVSYLLAKKLIKVKYISLVNLILDKPAVKELIQHELNRDNLVQELNLLLHDETRKKEIREDYQQLWDLLCTSSSGASQAAATEMIRLAARKDEY